MCLCKTLKTPIVIKGFNVFLNSPLGIEPRLGVPLPLINHVLGLNPVEHSFSQRNTMMLFSAWLNDVGNYVSPHPAISKNMYQCMQ